MTSRVQKGGPIFRPVVKSRTRPPTGDNRQSSILPDSINDSRHSVPTSPLTSTPSTSSIHISATPYHDGPLEGNTTHPASDSSYTVELSRATSNALASTSSGRPPTLTLVNSQGASLGEVLGKTLQSATSVISTSNDHVFHHPGAENVPTLTLNSGVLVQPQRISPKKANTITLPHDQEEGVGLHDPLHVKNTKRKKALQTGTAEPATSQLPQKRSVVTSSDADCSNDGTVNPTAHKRKRRDRSETPRPRRSRAPSLPPFDADADPGEEIDPTVVTMASLCSDTGQGRVSKKAAEILSNHIAWKIQNREKRARMKALMELKKYGREEDESGGTAGGTAPTSTDIEPSGTLLPGSSNVAALSNNTNDVDGGFDYSQDMTTSRFNVQVRIGPNGETIIDEESLVVDRTETDDTENYTHIVESDNTKFINSGSYGKRFRGSRWSAEETESFYDALSQYGENYELIAYVLPGRDRKSCKNKFKAEDKKNPARINYCLSNRIPVDMKTLSRMTGKDFSGPVPEIRAPAPRIETSAVAVDIDNAPIPEPIRGKRRGKKKTSDDHGVVIVGEAGSLEPFPESP